ncbi:nuclear transport factor 2 family protein [Streptomyces sp. NPDC058255]|uniref:nuclear transport factor 2 family protein n=1 Tax=Streptomyces sp. NPDC058255 TaxID=3346407 RepID=UPI0036E85FFF
MWWTRGLLAALAFCALLGVSAGCGTGDAHERRDEISASPVGKVLDETDEEGRHFREVDKKRAPEVEVEVQPDAAPGSGGSWDVTLTVHNFRFSRPGTPSAAVAGRGTAHLYLDGRTIARLRTAEYHLAGRLVPRGTHHVTARLYADDGTVWAVHGKPVESTADITASETGSASGSASDTGSASGSASETGSASASASGSASTPPPAVSGSGPPARTDTGGSPDPGGKAS